MSEKELKTLGDLGFNRWLDTRPNYKERYDPLIFDLVRFIRESLGIFIEPRIDLDSEFFWISYNISTGKEISRDCKGYDSPELALREGIKFTLENYGNN